MTRSPMINRKEFGVTPDITVRQMWRTSKVSVCNLKLEPNLFPARRRIDAAIYREAVALARSDF